MNILSESELVLGEGMILLMSESVPCLIWVMGVLSYPSCLSGVTIFSFRLLK